ncbi:hypothetical protein Rleg9DRAFT_6335 [Rhizobium leguminosarum bv. trifolii WSM597]|uniref:Uncharacterized protein n=1 Tax=Rhizobium leguminosarum bv. trifolii WSM597 TaxID=754764 RepID=J0HAB8_RHILT|nr:hypothetical protein Rleg9DRAFT_6335 [Rhizobium leguminosarum bv. trifolii WSM597]
MTSVDIVDADIAAGKKPAFADEAKAGAGAGCLFVDGVAAHLAKILRILGGREV